MDLTNMEGVEGDDSLLDHIKDTVMGDYIPDPEMEDIVMRDAMVIIEILRHRGYLTPEAIEQLKKEGL